MSLIPLFNAIKMQIQAQVGNTMPFAAPTSDKQKISYIHLWNEQLEMWRSETEQKNKMYPVQFPAILIEWKNVAMIQLGNGAQMYKDLLVVIHIIHKQLDAQGQGNHEQNTDVYALADAMYAALNFFKPNGAGLFIRKDHTLDWNHGNLYHFVQEWATNWIDLSQLQPVNGQTIPGGTVEPVIEASYNPAPFIKP